MQESMALSLYTHIIPLQIHILEIICWIVHCMVPSARTSMKMMFGGLGARNPIVQKAR